VRLREKIFEKLAIGSWQLATARAKPKTINHKGHEGTQRAKLCANLRLVAETYAKLG
jgi:hypothetical protein